MRMRDKIGIVTAAGSGMGRAGAIRFAAEGAAVTVVDLNPDAVADVVKTITDAGGKAIGLSGDLTDETFARGIVRDTTKAFGALDFVWNHVGSPGPASVEGLDWKEYDFTMNLNVKSVLITTEAALPELRARGTLDLIRLLHEGKIRVPIYDRIPLAEAPRAHRVFESGKVMGKLLMKP